METIIFISYCVFSVVVQAIIGALTNRCWTTKVERERIQERREQIHQERLYCEYIYKLGEGHSEAFEAGIEMYEFGKKYGKYPGQIS